MLHSSLTIEELERVLPEVLRDTIAQTCAAVAAAPPEQRWKAPAAQALRGLDCLLVGYSPQQASMVCSRYWHNEKSGAYVGERIPIGSGFFAPSDQAFMNRVELSGTIEEKLVALARQQMVFARERHSVRATGGKLLIATIDPDGMNIRSAAELS